MRIHPLLFRRVLHEHLNSLIYVCWVILWRLHVGFNSKPLRLVLVFFLSYIHFNSLLHVSSQEQTVATRCWCMFRHEGFRLQGFIVVVYLNLLVHLYWIQSFCTTCWKFCYQKKLGHSMIYMSLLERGNAFFSYWLLCHQTWPWDNSYIYFSKAIFEHRALHNHKCPCIAHHLISFALGVKSWSEVPAPPYINTCARL